MYIPPIMNLLSPLESMKAPDNPVLWTYEICLFACFFFDLFVFVGVLFFLSFFLLLLHLFLFILFTIEVNN